MDDESARRICAVVTATAIGLAGLGLHQYVERRKASSLPVTLDLAGKLFVVTGANSGIGLATSQQLAARGARVVMACRDKSKCAAAAAALRRSLGSGAVGTVEEQAREIER